MFIAHNDGGAEVALLMYYYVIIVAARVSPSPRKCAGQLQGEKKSVVHFRDAKFVFYTLDEPNNRRTQIKNSSSKDSSSDDFFFLFCFPSHSTLKATSYLYVCTYI